MGSHISRFIATKDVCNGFWTIHKQKVPVTRLITQVERVFPRTETSEAFMAVVALVYFTKNMGVFEDAPGLFM